MTKFMMRALLAVAAVWVAWWVMFGGLLWISSKARADDWKTRALGGVVIEAERVRVGFARGRPDAGPERRRLRLPASGRPLSKRRRAAPEPQRIEHRRRKPHKRRIGPPPRKVAKVIVAARRELIDEACRDAEGVVGDQYATELGARDAADKAWSQTIRWKLGERWMDRGNARVIRYECGRSSVGSVVGQVLFRCLIVAKPCRPIATTGEGK